MADKKPETVNFAVFWRILGYIKPYIKLAILCIIVSFIISGLHFVSIGMVNPLGDVLFTDEGPKLVVEKLNKFGEWGKKAAIFLQKHVFFDRYRTLYIIMGMIALLTLIKSFMRFIHDYCTQYICVRIQTDVSNELFGKVVKLPVHYFSKEGADQIASRFTFDINYMGRGVKSIFGKAMREPLKALASVIITLWINWKLTLIALVVFPIVLVLIKSIGRKVKKNVKKALKKSANLLNISQETFRGMQVIKAYQMEKNRHNRFIKDNEKLFEYNMKVTKADALTSPMMETIVTWAGIGILILTARMVMAGEMTVGDFLTFYVALGVLFDPIRKLADLNNRIQTSIAAGERVFHLMDQTPETVDDSGKETLKDIKESIAFQNVDFSYEPGIPVLQNISFAVNKGESIGIVGYNGSGKSTLISLLLRFYEVDNGAILVDGKDIRDFTIESLREQIGVVTQQAFLFSGSIFDNIACSADAGDEKIKEATKSTQIHEFIEKQEQGYQSLYGEGGIDFSGGQKQRIVLARALVRNPQIFILDEATANVDAKGESLIKENLDEFIQQRTTFIIAHHFSTLKKVNRILVLNNGKVEGFGTHDELMAESDTYSDLYGHQ